MSYFLLFLWQLFSIIIVMFSRNCVTFWIPWKSTKEAENSMLVIYHSHELTSWSNRIKNGSNRNLDGAQMHAFINMGCILLNEDVVNCLLFHWTGACILHETWRIYWNFNWLRSKQKSTPNSDDLGANENNAKNTKYNYFVIFRWYDCYKKHSRSIQNLDMQ